jgi:EpsI family protein
MNKRATVTASPADNAGRSVTRRAALAATCMALAAAAGQAMVPTRRMADLRGAFKLDDLVPRRFADWSIDPYAQGGLVNPQTEALLKRTYSQMLERTYVNGAGKRIMLSIAYGDDQSDASVQLHYPEVCYPAQGFAVRSSRRDAVSVAAGRIEVRRLETEMARVRAEPVTYWTMIGDQQSLGGWEHKWAEIRHGLHGEIVDGLLFRVSSIGLDTAAAFALQDGFIRDLVTAMTPAARRFFTGLS